MKISTLIERERETRGIFQTLEAMEDKIFKALKVLNEKSNSDICKNIDTVVGMFETVDNAEKKELITKFIGDESFYINLQKKGINVLIELKRDLKLFEEKMGEWEAKYLFWHKMEKKEFKDELKILMLQIEEIKKMDTEYKKLGQRILETLEELKSILVKNKDLDTKISKTTSTLRISLKSVKVQYDLLDKYNEIKKGI